MNEKTVYTAAISRSEIARCKAKNEKNTLFIHVTYNYIVGTENHCEISLDHIVGIENYFESSLNQLIFGAMDNEENIDEESKKNCYINHLL